MPIDQQTVVRAAGGIIWRRRGDRGRLELALVHRAVQEDWTFPKGKLLEGETEREAALREAKEETGLRCQPGDFLGRVRYRDRRGRLKTVAYWEMRSSGGRFLSNAEVDELRWLTPDIALQLLSYRQDRRLLGTLLKGDRPRHWSH
ncbi:MAG TPA: NUDIX hydrolase [Actinomycetes bacterium]|jgi:8-oxo-dGTP diphosphatase|nr:NUDIX hydrolase [Actinomycetes bacterium]